MNSTIYLIFLINIFFCTIAKALPHERIRRQPNPNKKAGLPYEGWSGGLNNPSGGNPGAYYGTGINPNYGGIGAHRNDVNEGINVVSYNHEYTHNGGSNSNWRPQQQQQQQQQQYYWLNNNNNNNNNNNAWQRPNTNNYYNQPYNRYPPGSQGWYASGGNYWYNKGQSLVSHVWLLIISISISISIIYIL
ncbi:unnamed protein product [Adineta steineri]|uniref:Uncharacterized protein n=1 Tax=Adineta steineri TaxID=433720 RepID=A0A814LPF6_9BILA|nr:unnamed protein product [Adineta steineri]CAF3677332.1 unnamed protein product [Adineta steineri]CAF3803717.1 unnamed protein product [Adineta steineri]